MKVSIRFEPGEWYSLLKSSLLIALLVGYTTTESELSVVGIHRLVHEPLEQCRVKVLSTFAGVLREKIGTRAIFTKILANYILEEGFITANCDKKYNLSAFLSWKCQGPVRRETTEGFSIEFIWHRMRQHKQNGCTILL